MDANKGYFLMHRNIADNPFYTSERFDKAHALLDLYILAGYKEREVFIREKNIRVTLRPGQLCYSMKSLAHRWHWDRRTVKDFLQNLKELGYIDFAPDNKTTVITILNWEKEQKPSLSNKNGCSEKCQENVQHKSSIDVQQEIPQKEIKTQELSLFPEDDVQQKSSDDVQRNVPRNAHKQLRINNNTGKKLLFDENIIPEELRVTPGFTEAIKLWITHRKQKRKSLTPTCMELLYENLCEYKKQGKDVVAAIKSSIRRDYPEIYPDNSFNQKQENRQTENNVIELKRSQEEDEDL